MGKVYEGLWQEDELFCRVRVDGGPARPLTQGRGLISTPPQGETYGYYPDQWRALAVALLVDATGSDQVAVDLGREFASYLRLTMLPGEWALDETAVLAWVAADDDEPMPSGGPSTLIV